MQGTHNSPKCISYFIQVPNLSKQGRIYASFFRCVLYADVLFLLFSVCVCALCKNNNVAPPREIIIYIIDICASNAYELFDYSYQY